MEKPTKAPRVFTYDYHECQAYLEARDGYNERDYAGRFAGHPDAPYQDFWHFVVLHAEHITNGCTFTMCADWAEGAEPWQQAILAKYLETFGEETSEGERYAEFYVCW